MQDRGLANKIMKPFLQVDSNVSGGSTIDEGKMPSLRNYTLPFRSCPGQLI